jgi:hypothetical protein
MSSSRFPRTRWSSFLFIFLVGCSTAPKPGEFSSRELMEAACPSSFLGSSGVRSIKGSVWTRIESKEMSGQFPATVRVEYPRFLGVEVTNLIGAPQAWLKVEDGKTDLSFSASNEKKYGKPQARTMLGGLPVDLAPRLFAGGVPCPKDGAGVRIDVRQTPDGDLIVEEVRLRDQALTRYVYSFMRYAGKPWVKEMRLEKLAKGARRGAKSNLITIIREEPAGADDAPMRWSASSDAGEIRVRWKDRDRGI